MVCEMHRLVKWLLENGGPSIRYRTITELLETESCSDQDVLTNELLHDPEVKLWLHRLEPSRKFSDIHHSKNTSFENAMGKLFELGVRANMVPFDEKTLVFRRWLGTESRKYTGMLPLLCKVIVASSLVRAGYGDKRIVRSFLCQRLEDLYQSVQKRTHDIHIDSSTYSGIPKAFRRYPHVKPEFCPNAEFKLPYIHDIYALAYFPTELKNNEVNEKISAIVSYILQRNYQALPHGYGYLREDRGGKQRYYVIGWEVSLLGYHSFNVADWTNWEVAYFVQRVELMAHFPEARKHRWFHQSIQHLESFRTSKGTYLLPRSYLREQQGYWVMGSHMGLEQNRRTSQALELESTFWMLRLKQQVAGCN